MDWLQAGDLQLANLLFAFPKAKNRRAPVQEFPASTLFALGNNNRNKVNRQSLSLVKSQVNNHGKDKEKQKSYLSKG